MERNASVYQVNPVSRKAGEGRAEFLRTWGPDFDQQVGGRWERRGATGGAAQFVRGNYESFKGINLTVLEKKYIYKYQVPQTPSLNIIK